MADIRALGSRDPDSPQVREARLKKATQDFEALFLAQMWKQMRQGVGKDGLLSSPQSESYISMFDQEMGVKMAEAGGIGLGDMLFRQLQTRLERAGHGAPAPLRPLRAPVASASGAASSAASSPGPAQPDPSAAAVDALAERIVREKAQALAPGANAALRPEADAAHGPQTASAAPLSSGEGIWLTW
ncbi:MAG: rod-binding protein [Desulfomicrobiaceae bacterium]